MNSGKLIVFPTQIQAISNALLEVIWYGKRPDQVLESEFRKLNRPGSRDRSIVAESVYELIRYWRFWWFLLNKETSISPDLLEDLINFYFNNRTKSQSPDINLPPQIQYSVPDETWQIGIRELGNKWCEEVIAQSSPAPIHIRANRIKNSAGELREKLYLLGIESEFHDLCQDALIIKGRYRKLFQTDLFKSGCFELQDAGSQRVSILANPLPGTQIIDACAGAGGKSLHMAALMGNKGKIIAMDIFAHKLSELKRRARRAGVTIIETKLIDNQKPMKTLKNSADLVLIDAPCSGSGTWRRNPDLKYKLTYNWLANCTNLQEKLLHDYSIMVKPGGILVYSTCSIFPSENEVQWHKFLKNHPDFIEMERKTLWPSLHQCDGFFMAKAQKKSYKSIEICSNI